MPVRLGFSWCCRPLPHDRGHQHRDEAETAVALGAFVVKQLFDLTEELH